MRMNQIHKTLVVRFMITMAFCLSLPVLAGAYVTGPCANCHTMHNSSNGTTLTTGTTYGDAAAPNLLRGDCLGCHMSTTSATINVSNGTTTPIVYNTVPPATELAGGNFYWTNSDGSNTAADHNRGHNVKGIATADMLPYAPGANSPCAGSCHVSLVADVSPGQETGLATATGCQGCHLRVGHHVRNSLEGGPADGAGDAFRFLGGHDTSLTGPVNSLQGANEDPDWQFTTGPNDYNLYWGGDAVDNVKPMSIGRFCAGCHSAFHSTGRATGLGPSNGGDRDIDVVNTPTPWLRHPTDVHLPGVGVDGEFARLFDTPGNYDPAMPFARAAGTLRTAPLDSPDQVMCLSCHKAHGSQYPNALRWDYTTTIAHVGGPNLDTGCFYCHREKDDP